MLANKNHSGFYFAKESDQYVIKVKRYLTADGKFVRADRIATEYDLDVQENQEPLEVEKIVKKMPSSGKTSFKWRKSIMKEIEMKEKDSFPTNRQDFQIT